MSTENSQRQIYMDTNKGLLYYQTDAGTTMEMADDILHVKVRVSKFTDWKSIADLLFQEMLKLSQWGFDHMEKETKKIPPIKRKKEIGSKAYDPFFTDEVGWKMYVSEDDYLFIYEVNFNEQAMVTDANDFACICYLPLDALGNMTTFLSEWYSRVNGYPEEEE